MAGEGKPFDPAQARIQMIIHVKAVGVVAGPKGVNLFRLHALSDMTLFINLLEWGRIAGRLYENGAAKTAFCPGLSTDLGNG